MIINHSYSVFGRRTRYPLVLHECHHDNFVICFSFVILSFFVILFVFVILSILIMILEDETLQLWSLCLQGIIIINRFIMI